MSFASVARRTQCYYFCATFIFSHKHLRINKFEIKYEFLNATAFVVESNAM